MPRRVVIVDDHPLWRRALRDALAPLPWVGEIVEAGTAAEAMRLIEDGDLVAMDIYLEDEDGILAAKKIRRRHPSVRIVIVTMSPPRHDRDRAEAAGVQGYVDKKADLDTILDVFSSVAGAQPGARRSPRKNFPPPFDMLTNRERQILARVFLSDKSERIAHDLKIGHQHVRNRLTTIYAKLGVKGRMEAVKLMHEKGIDKLDEDT